MRARMLRTNAFSNRLMVQLQRQRRGNSWGMMAQSCRGRQMIIIRRIDTEFLRIDTRTNVMLLILQVHPRD